MDRQNTLRRYGLFDANVPRYTSYPPANRFEAGVGARRHADWLDQVSAEAPVSIYVHVPFCRRLCWFCACRTQGTKTLGPVERYVDVLIDEITTVAKRHLPRGLPMARLHLGGGTPTLLTQSLMDRLLDTIFSRFAPSEGFEFSVEIDPTEAAPAVLHTLADHGMTRASVGVQDFDRDVQQAIGRIQGFEVTQHVIAALRDTGVQSLNVDLLYGLPYQTNVGLLRTLDRVISLNPDRLALYGYAHVPHVSKRQVMIPGDALPGAEQRFEMSQIARDRLVALGYDALGIDHFARPSDSLARAARAGTMSRNFQGYTDDPCATLIGFGASAISRFPQGYVQNAVSTSAYLQRVGAGGLAGHKGIVLEDEDRLIAAMIDALMCQGELRPSDIAARFPGRAGQVDALTDSLLLRFPELLSHRPGAITIREGFAAATRLISAHLDANRGAAQIHCAAV